MGDLGGDFAVILEVLGDLGVLGGDFVAFVFVFVANAVTVTVTFAAVVVAAVVVGVLTGFENRIAPPPGLKGDLISPSTTTPFFSPSPLTSTPTLPTAGKPTETAHTR